MGKSKASKRGDQPSPTSGHLTDTWTRHAEQLHGLLSIQADEPFIDLDNLCPRSAWLVLHLDLVRPVTSIRLVLDALAVLCVRSERLRFDDKLHEAYWRQMLTSDLMREAPSSNAPVVSKFVRFVQHKNVRVMLSWEGKRFPSSVATQLRGFLDATTSQYETVADVVDGRDVGSKWRVWRPLGVGIRVGHAVLTSADIKTIKDMLSQPTTGPTTVINAKTIQLCEQHTLCKLDLHGNRMGTGELRELTRLLEDPLCRRIDDLDLEKTLPVDMAASIDAKYVAAFKTMVAAALTSKALPTSNTYVRSDAGFAISLARNTMYDGLHLKALHDALETATRRLSGLSLAYTKHEVSCRSQSGSPSTSQKWLARICMTSPATSFADEAVLDLTLADINSDMDKFHGELREVLVPRLREALERNVPLWCRGRQRLSRYPIWNDSTPDGWLPRGATRRLLEVLDDGWCRVEGPVVDDSDEEEESGDDSDEDNEEEESVDGSDDEEEGGEEEAADVDTAVRVLLASICQVYSVEDGPDVMRMRFTALVCDGASDQYGPISAPESSFLMPFLASTGTELKRISLRHWHDMHQRLSLVMTYCRNLHELDLQGSKINGGSRELLWRSLHESHWATLEAINVSATDIGTTFFDSIHQQLVELTEDLESSGEKLTVKLRYLSLLDCKFNVSQVARLRDFLQTNKSLELVELDASVIPSGIENEPSPSKMALSVSLDHDNERLNSTSLAVDRKVAFACVLPKLSQFRNADIDSVVLSRCLEYAGSVTTRRIVWCESVPLRKWLRPHQTTFAAGRQSSNPL